MCEEVIHGWMSGQDYRDMQVDDGRLLMLEPDCDPRGASGLGRDMNDMLRAIDGDIDVNSVTPEGVRIRGWMSGQDYLDMQDDSWKELDFSLLGDALLDFKGFINKGVGTISETHAYLRQIAYQARNYEAGETLLIIREGAVAMLALRNGEPMMTCPFLRRQGYCPIFPEYIEDMCFFPFHLLHPQWVVNVATNGNHITDEKNKGSVPPLTMLHCEARLLRAFIASVRMLRQVRTTLD